MDTIIDDIFSAYPENVHAKQYVPYCQLISFRRVNILQSYLFRIMFRCLSVAETQNKLLYFSTLKIDRFQVRDSFDDQKNVTDNIHSRFHPIFRMNSD